MTTLDMIIVLHCDNVVCVIDLDHNHCDAIRGNVCVCLYNVLYVYYAFSELKLVALNCDD